MTDKNNAANPEAHPLPWTALPADEADLFEGADMWFFNDANGEEVFYGCAMSAEIRDLVMEAVNESALLSKLRAPVADERPAQEYGSPADVAQRIEQYLAHDGRMNSGTQLLYEAMKALRGLPRGSK